MSLLILPSTRSPGSMVVSGVITKISQISKPNGKNESKMKLTKLWLKMGKPFHTQHCQQMLVRRAWRRILGHTY